MDQVTRFPQKKWLASGAIALGAILLLFLKAQDKATIAAETPAIPAAAGGGELVYVPIYSSIFYENGKQTLDLAATLSIHNINSDSPITIVRADYYDTDGKLIHKYLTKPLVLGTLQTKNIVIEKENKAGGTGANFLVECQAKSGTASPLIEAVMVNASSNLGIAFTTTGKVVRASVAAK